MCVHVCEHIILSLGLFQNTCDNVRLCYPHVLQWRPHLSFVRPNANAAFIVAGESHLRGANCRTNPRVFRPSLAWLTKGSLGKKLHMLINNFIIDQYKRTQRKYFRILSVWRTHIVYPLMYIVVRVTIFRWLNNLLIDKGMFCVVVCFVKFARIFNNSYTSICKGKSYMV